MKTIITGFMLLFLSVGVQAAVQNKAVTYKDGKTTLNGFLYWDGSIEGPRPGVLVIHEWWGLNDYAKKRAGVLAELGFVAFAADMYGDGHVTDKPDQARTWMQEVMADVEGWRAGAMLGWEQLRASGMVAGDNLAAIGYCFGGATVLHMSYANLPVRGVVSFRGSLPAAPEESKGSIGRKILVLHGNADAWVAPKVVANWEMNSYGSAKHGFTNPDAGRFKIPNLEYNAQADERSWSRMQAFFSEIFD